MFSRLDVPDQTSAVRIEARDWLARADFFARHASALGLHPPAAPRTPKEAP